MTVGKDTIEFYKGTDATLNFSMNTAEDISSWAIQFTVRGADGSALIDEGPCDIDDGPNGLFSIGLDDTLTDTLRLGTYVYTCWRTDAGFEQPLSVGKFIVLDHARDVTQ